MIIEVEYWLIIDINCLVQDCGNSKTEALVWHYVINTKSMLFICEKV